jgi:hypothetical protein
MNKNADGAMDYLDSVLSATSPADLQRLVADSKFLAFVQRAAGGGRLFLTLQTSASRDEKDHVNLPIRNVIRFKGSAASDAKKAQANTMQRGDYVIVDGAYASARLTVAQAHSVRRVFNTYAVPVPKGFFAELESAEDDAGGFAFDRSEEEEAEARAEEERQAAIARRAIVKAGGAGRGGAPRVSLRDAAAALADREEGERGADRVEEDEEDDGLESGGAAAGAEPAKPKGPNRAERRAAEARAREEAEARAAAEAAGFNLYGAAEEEEDWTVPALPQAADKGWEELADELDIDAI